MQHCLASESCFDSACCMNVGRTAEEVMSTEQLCQRRLENVRQLKELYEAELLNALEEQRSRQCRSLRSAPGRV